MQIGIDFGTSNTSIGYSGPQGIRLIELEPDATSIPTAVFYGLASGEYAIGAYETGEEGRLMRSIKSVLGSSLIDETTDVGRRRLPFRDVIAHFLRRVIARAEAETGERVESVVQGRPVSFNDRDADLDRRAQAILESCLRDAGVAHVEFLDEPVAAARSVSFPSGREKLVFVVDIGGGTSDFSVVRIAPDNDGFDVLGSTGLYVGGNDFDQKLSFFELSRLLGMWFALEDANQENGCLWGLPGGHRRGLKARFLRSSDGGVEMLTLDDTPWPEADFVPLEVAKGALILLDGMLPHGSAANRSSVSRQAYSLHVIDGTCRYLPENWLQRGPDMPLRGFS